MLKHVLASALLSASCIASAAPVVDQLSPLPEFGFQVIYVLGLSQTATYAQSFRPSQQTVSGAGVSVTNSSDIPAVTISLYDKLPTQGGTVLASATASWVVREDYFLDAFWDPVTVVASQTYYLLFTSNSTDTAFAGSVDGYAGGQFEGTDADGYTAYPGTDFVFRTFADDGRPNEASEPGSLALLGLGLAGIGALRHRRDAGPGRRARQPGRYRHQGGM